jgi:hypothetical protein
MMVDAAYHQLLAPLSYAYAVDSGPPPPSTSPPSSSDSESTNGEQYCETAVQGDEAECHRSSCCEWEDNACFTQVGTEECTDTVAGVSYSWEAQQFQSCPTNCGSSDSTLSRRGGAPGAIHLLDGQ